MNRRYLFLCFSVSVAIKFCHRDDETLRFIYKDHDGLYMLQLVKAIPFDCEIVVINYER